MAEFTVRPAKAHEERAGRMLLPEAYAGRASPLLLVATVGAPPQVIGAAALLSRPHARGRSRAVMIRVAKPHRRQGIGRALVEAAVNEAKSRGIKALCIPEPVDSVSEEARAWTALGFAIDVESHHHETGIAEILNIIGPLWDQVEQHGWRPPESRIVGLREAPPENVARMHVKELGGAFRAVLWRIRGSARESYDPELSYILMLDDRVVGAALGREIKPGVAFFDAIIVVPELRLGWARLMLIAHACRRALDRDISTVRFVAQAKHRDTLKLAAKAGAKRTKTMVMMRRPMAS